MASLWAQKAAAKIIEYTNEGPPDEIVFAEVIQLCYERYSKPEANKPALVEGQVTDVPAGT